MSVNSLLGGLKHLFAGGVGMTAKQEESAASNVIWSSLSGLFFFENMHRVFQVYYCVGRRAPLLSVVDISNYRNYHLFTLFVLLL